MVRNLKCTSVVNSGKDNGCQGEHWDLAVFHKLTPYYRVIMVIGIAKRLCITLLKIFDRMAYWSSCSQIYHFYVPLTICSLIISNLVVNNEMQMSCHRIKPEMPRKLPTDQFVMTRSTSPPPILSRAGQP